MCTAVNTLPIQIYLYTSSLIKNRIYYFTSLLDAFCLDLRRQHQVAKHNSSSSPQLTADRHIRLRYHYTCGQQARNILYLCFGLKYVGQHDVSKMEPTQYLCKCVGVILCLWQPNCIWCTVASLVLKSESLKVILCKEVELNICPWW